MDASMNGWQKAAMGGLAGGDILGGLFGLFGGGKNPADEAVGTLGKIPGQITPYFQPYMDAGKNQLPGYQNMINKLMSDPDSIIKMLGQGYQQSPGYQWNLQQGESAINNANAAGGLLGTPQHQQQAGQLATNLANQDFNTYLQNAMNLFGKGFQGAGGLVDTGARASSSLADAIAQVLGQQAQYQYAGQAGQNQAMSSGLSNIGSGLGALASIAGFL